MKEAKKMVEFLAKYMSEDRIRKSEDARCPPEYCRHEYRNEDSSGRMTPSIKV